RVVGKNGIIVEPHPVLRNGAIARDLAAEIRTRWSEWSVSPEVSQGLTSSVTVFFRFCFLTGVDTGSGEGDGSVLSGTHSSQ
ncbi:hypothetical protein ACSLNK_29435, partial [Escherichia coli]